MKKFIICKQCKESVLTIQNKISSINIKHCYLLDCVIVNREYYTSDNSFKISLSGRFVDNLIDALVLNKDLFEDMAKTLVISNMDSKKIHSFEHSIYSSNEQVLEIIENLIRKCDNYNLLG